MKCPICNNELYEISFTEEIWGTFEKVETHQKCTKCNLYEYEYAYGNSARTIYNKMFCDDREHKFYIKLVRFLYKLKLIGGNYERNFRKNK